MDPDRRGARTALAWLRREIASDRRAMDARLGEVVGILDDSERAEPDRPHLAFAAVALHAWYTGMEALLERVARELDHEVPTGDTSHRELLSQAMTEVEEVRPAVLPEGLAPDLVSLLGFRHFFRRAYGVELDSEKLRIEMRRLVRIAPGVADALDRFDGFLEATEQALSS